VYGSPAAALAHLRGELVTVEPSFVDFGSGKPGDVIERTVTVYNWSDQPVRLIGGTADCTCRVTQDLPATIGASSQIALPVKIRILTSLPGSATRAAELTTDSMHLSKLRFTLGFQVMPYGR
jgi:hypothetical protein